MASGSRFPNLVFHFGVYKLVGTGLDILITCKSGFYGVSGYLLTPRRSSSLHCVVKKGNS